MSNNDILVIAPLVAQMHFRKTTTLFGESGCLVYAFLFNIYLVGTPLFMLLNAAERYIAVVYPLRLLLICFTYFDHLFPQIFLNCCIRMWSQEKINFLRTIAGQNNSVLIILGKTEGAFYNITAEPLIADLHDGLKWPLWSQRLMKVEKRRSFLHFVFLNQYLLFLCNEIVGRILRQAVLWNQFFLTDIHKKKKTLNFQMSINRSRSLNITQMAA